MKRNTNRWEEYCETTYNSLKANVHNWGRPEFFRPLTRTYYMGVFDCGNPNHTNLITIVCTLTDQILSLIHI